MKKILSLFAFMMLCVVGANAEWKQVYKVDYSDYTSFPFYVMGFTPEWVDGVMTDQGAEGWHQYFIGDQIPTEVGGSYTVKAMVKASEEVSINVNMGWGWNEGEIIGTSVTIGTEWQEVKWEYDNVGGTSCNLVAQPSKGGVTIEWKYLEVGYEETGETYTVAGTTELTGYDWDVTQNKMKFDAEASLYKWTATGIAVTENSNLAFKIVKDLDWNNGSWPDNNWVINTDVTGGKGIFTITISFNAETKEIIVTPVKTEDIVEGWTDLIVNGDMEGDDSSCFYVTEQGIGGPFLAPFTEGIGKDGSKAVKVESYDDPAQDWDSQFFIRLPYQVPAGTKFKVSFDYKADKAGDFDTQAHTEPGGYIHYVAIGSGSFTTDWQTYEAEGTVSADMSKEGQIFQTIAFNLAKNKVRTNFIFDNVKFEVPENVVATLTLNPATNPQPYTRPVYNSMAIVGDFLGLATDENPDANWNPATGWAMTQDTDNPAVWTLVKDEFTAEAKTYEYKATANGNWDDYVLPADKNADYNFDTPNLGAGKYKLTFTVDTRKHSVNLDTEKLDATTYTATFTTDAEWAEVYAYAWTTTDKGTTEFLGAWPGTKLKAVNGVYTVSIETTDAPEKIIFNNGNSGEGNQTADLDFVNGSAYEFKAATGEEAPVKEAPEGWTLGTSNGNLAGDDVSNYVSKEYPSSDVVGATIELGAGTNGSRGIIVRAGDDTNHLNDKGEDASQDWDSQFWIVLPEALPAGSKLHVEFDYKASKAAKGGTQAHGNPGAYQHWAAIGDVNFTEDWQSFSADIDVDESMAKGDNGNGSGVGLLSIAFNLQIERSAVDYRFDNFGVWYQKAAEPVEITSMAIVGDFLGLATDENPDADWDPANGWAMEQAENNPAVWTLTKKFTAEAKKYEYKATANGKYGDYELPAEGNQNFVFGTDEYPAGDYFLIFTANTESNTLTLDVKPVPTPVFDFENNNGNWAEGATFVDGTTMKGITLTGDSKVKFEENQLKFTAKNSSIKLAAPEGKVIVKVEFKALSSIDRLDLTTTTGELGEQPTDIIDKHSIWTWTGKEAEVSFSLTGARNRSLGYIDVILEDVATGISTIVVNNQNNAIFNLNGQKVQNVTKGGIYIINGKKQVVK